MVSPDVSGSIVGNVISLGLFLSPAPTFWGIYKKKNVEEFSPLPYLATTLNCVLWVFYGTLNSKLVITINGVGLAMEAVYLLAFLLHAPYRKRRRVLAVLGVEAVLVAALVLGVLLGAHTHDERSLAAGITAAVANTIMYATPLAVMRKVIATRSVEYMPFCLSLTGLLNGACWSLTAYALIEFDPFIIIPNTLGVFLSVAQLVLYGCYYKSTPKNVELPTALPKSNSTIINTNISTAAQKLKLL